MRIVTFDLSSTCIGVSMAILNDDYTFKQVATLPIIPVKPTGMDLGYTTKTKKKIASGGNEFRGFLKPGETVISKAEAEKRNREFKVLEHNYLLRNIGKQCGLLLKKMEPDVVVIERNSSFNGVLTTKLLAEIAGGIYFYCGANDIEMHDEHEATVRAYIRKTITDFSYENENGIKAIDTKWEIRCRLKAYFGELMDFSVVTLDETDALAVMYYHVMKRREEVLDDKERILDKMK